MDNVFWQSETYVNYFLFVKIFIYLLCGFLPTGNNQWSCILLINQKFYLEELHQANGKDPGRSELEIKIKMNETMKVMRD